MREFLVISRALSDASRVNALLMLRDGELCVCQIIEMLALSPSTVSRHMTLLYDAGLVCRRKEGRWHYYRLPTDAEATTTAMQALDWLMQSLDEQPAANDTRLQVAQVRCKDLQEGMRVLSKVNILFLCTGNSCRSQMAEGWARHLIGDVVTPYSAGIEKHGLNPHAVAAMREAGVDISQHVSKTLDDLADVKIDVVVTVCGHAHETCPRFPGEAVVIHHGFDDPPRLAKDEPDPAAAFGHYQRVRDEIRRYITTLPNRLSELTDRPTEPEQGVKP